jgi:hypothetical protein
MFPQVPLAPPRIRPLTLSRLLLNRRDTASGAESLAPEPCRSRGRGWQVFWGVWLTAGGKAALRCISGSRGVIRRPPGRTDPTDAPVDCWSGKGGTGTAGKQADKSTVRASIGPVRAFGGRGRTQHPSTAKNSCLRRQLHMGHNDWCPTLACSVSGRRRTCLPLAAPERWFKLS